MFVVVSTLFHVLCFPHQGKIVTIDQLAYFNSYSHIGSVSFIEKTPSSYENVGVGILKDSSLMGNFPLPPPKIPLVVAQFDMILMQVQQSLESFDPLVVHGLNEHSSLSLSSSLKSETYGNDNSSLSLSSSLKNETDANKHKSLSLSSLLKNEIDPSPSESSLPLDIILEPSFLHLVKLFLSIARRLNEERRSVDGGNYA
jgi:hypothetical protein